MNSNGDLKQEVRRLLRTRKENARTGKELARILGMKDDRMIREIILELIEEGMPIASSVKPPYYGYFIADTPEEVEEYTRVLQSRLKGDAYRCKGFRLASRKILQPHQMALIW